MRDKSRLADDQCAWYATTRGIVLDDKIGRRVPAIPPESGQGCHNHSVLESDRADLDGLKKLGCSHCKASVYFRGMLGAVVLARDLFYTVHRGRGMQREACWNDKLHTVR